MKLRKVSLFGNDRQKRYFTVNAEGHALPRFFAYEGKIYERFNALSTATAVRYCEVAVRQLSDLVVSETEAIDVTNQV